MELVLDAPDIDGVVIDPWGHSATLDEALLNGLLHAGHNPDCLLYTSAAKVLLNKGVQQVYISLGSDGLYAEDQAGRHVRPVSYTHLDVYKRQR